MASSDWHPKGFEAYAKSDYTFEDAQTLADLWSIPVGEAKQVLGHKILNDIQDLLPEGLQRPSASKVDPKFDPKLDPKTTPAGVSKTFLAYVKSDYDYEDAELLASLWNLSVVEAKDEIGYKVIHGLEANLPDKLRDNDIVEVHLTPEDKAYEAFRQSDYDYDDAELLSGVWGLSIVEAKQMIGSTVITKMDQLLPDKIYREQGC